MKEKMQNDDDDDDNLMERRVRIKTKRKIQANRRQRKYEMKKINMK